MIGVQTPLERAGQLLFRWRALVGFAGFWVVFWFGDGGALTCLAGLPLLGAGLALRTWAMGYIGPLARGREFETGRYVGAGPYRWFRLSSRSPAGHPLYAGNFLLVLGILVALWPTVLLGLAVLALFVLEYQLVARSEERWLIARFGPHPDRTVGFSWRNARHEWSSWLLTGFAWGLCWVRAGLVQVRG
jgi:protein-S-isoprenylcysteine O-methyltransferase Ste14